MNKIYQKHFTNFVSLKRSGSADLPLHYGHVPVWLAERMAKMGLATVENILIDYGKDDLLRRLSDPFWFQSMGAVMGKAKPPGQQQLKLFLKKIAMGLKLTAILYLLFMLNLFQHFTCKVNIILFTCPVGFRNKFGMAWSFYFKLAANSLALVKCICMVGSVALAKS